MVPACLIPPSNGRDGVLFTFFHVYHGRDGARTSRRSHHGSDNQGKMKNKSMHYSSRPRGEGKSEAVAVTAHDHGRDQA